MALAIRLANDDTFLKLADLLGPGDIGRQYQPHDGYGRAVIEEIVTRVVSSDATRRQIKFRLHGLTAVTSFPEAPLEPGDRRRFRGLAWREDAIETLLSIGSRRCLAPGCTTIRARDSHGHYCGQHFNLEREHGGLVANRHDAAIAAVADLLEEVGELLGVRPNRSVTAA